MSLSKSKYCNGLQCKKMLYLNMYYPNEKESENDRVLDNGTNVGIIAKSLFGNYIDINFSDNLSDMIKDTKSLLNINNIVITEASFNYDNNFCSVDILKKDKDNYEIYEVKSSTNIKDIYLDDISYQYYILTNLGYNVTKCSLVNINNNYVRHGDIELDKLFTITDVTSDIIIRQEKVKNKIDEINEYLKEGNHENDNNLSINCMHPYPCLFFKYCTKSLPSKNIFNIRGMTNNKKFDFYNKGIISYEDLIKENILPKYKEQIEFELYDKEDYIDKDKIKYFLDTLSCPLYFLDFETYQVPVPEYDESSPYEQIPFQYSLHYYLDDKENLLHKEFLAEPNTDPRRVLAQRLVDDIPLNVCTLAYNMSFEKSVIKKLAFLYPDLKDHLMNIHDNMKDLMIPFKNRYYYTKEMYGSYSIKYVLPALFPNDEALNYHNLENVHNGAEASNAFLIMRDLSNDELNSLKKNLLNYCGLDTYAMVKIYDKLKEVTTK